MSPKGVRHTLACSTLRSYRHSCPRVLGQPTASATIIDGKAIAAEVRAQVAQDVAASRSRPRRPDRALVGEDPASAVYVGGKKAVTEVGIAGFRHDLPADSTRGAGRRADRAAQRRSGGQRDPLSAARSGPSGRRRAHLDRRQGRRRPPRRSAPGRLALGATRPALRAPRAGTTTLIAARRRHAPGRPRRRRVVGPTSSASRWRRAAAAAHATVTIGALAHAGPPGRSAAAADVLDRRRRHGRSSCAADWVKPGATVIDVGINRIDFPEQRSGRDEDEARR